MSDKNEFEQIDVEKPVKSVNFSKLLAMFLKRDLSARPAPQYLRKDRKFADAMRTYSAIREAFNSESWRFKNDGFCITIAGDGHNVTLEGNTAFQFMTHEKDLLAELLGAGWVVAPCR